MAKLAPSRRIAQINWRVYEQDQELVLVQMPVNVSLNTISVKRNCNELQDGESSTTLLIKPYRCR